MSPPKAIFLADPVFFINGNPVDYVYGEDQKSRLAHLIDIDEAPLTYNEFKSRIDEFSSVQYIFSCWGMPALSDEDLDALPNLKFVFYASGSVTRFAAPFFNRGIQICSAVEANAKSVAEFCLGQILLSCKRTFTVNRICRQGPWIQKDIPVGKGVYGETVALIGIGAVCRHLIKLLKNFNLRIIAYSDYLDDTSAREMGIDELVDIKRAFAEGYIVSNHLPNKSYLEKIFTEEHFLSMRENSTFINTGRGQQVDESGLISSLKKRPDLTALLDVQDPEPPEQESDLYSLSNVYMTSHIAGCMNDEVQRMADWVIDDFESYLGGKPLKALVNPELSYVRA
ncbi:hydroxyacid dehydrogenase [Rubellicoccus peritrichatus]|uniref:Hydroxyacid dehydrogenase n=1 Tax=Rubellicoccus peritrichatus TaxID=3080537 RepID=A0AAQ3LCV3_9BACT|nr:hydroxyacid dehydrogenase [Puniceicoccus sp. CR14]WOO39619.1 hydroxyacid dehydrogenase [Puniceicoccus sp. CR14]